ncbi:MAG: hypothetical protein U1F00_23600 [Rhodoferax sp.]
MVDDGIVFRKSALGTQAIATRQPPLPPRLRALLIMVDGLRTVQALGSFVAAPASAGALLSELERLGLVERAAGGGASGGSQPAPELVQAPPPPAQAQAQAAGGGTTVPLAEVRRHAVRTLLDLLGPAAEPLCVRIEAAGDWAAFVESVKRVRESVRGMRGPEAANRYTESIERFIEGRS